MADVLMPNMQRRYEKIRRLCRQLNRNRRLLRDKVDLLCADLVQSNVVLTQTVKDLRHAFEFQSELMGEFDLHHMLHKGLRLIRQKIQESSTALYLPGEENISAHLTCSWYHDPAKISELEKAFLRGIIPRTIEDRKSLMIVSGNQWPNGDPPVPILSGLSLFACPLIHQKQVEGVLILYRDDTNPLGPSDRRVIESLVGPLARAIVGVRKLQHQLVAS